MLKLDRNNPNAFIGIVLLVVLVVFVLPDRLPGSIAGLSPQLFAGIPCARLPAARNLSAHQSVLGRQAKDPLHLTLTAGDINDEGGFVMRLSVANHSLATVPIVFQADNFVVAEAEDDSDGFSLIIRPAPESGLKARANPNPASYDEGDIRLLGPRQSCVHSLELAASAAMIRDGGSARARYRMRAGGEQQPRSESVREIFPDQGLDILTEGAAFSEEVDIAPRT